NWLSSSLPALYAQGDFATFDDTATGTTGVNITASETPGSLTVNNSILSYTFSGPGKISGGTSLVKQGTGTLIVDNNGNDFIGGVTISGGILQVGKSDANGNLPATGSVTDNGTLTFAHTDAVSVPNTISGSGALVQNGSGVLTVSGPNTFSGPVTISQ